MQEDEKCTIDNIDEQIQRLDEILYYPKKTEQHLKILISNMIK